MSNPRASSSAVTSTDQKNAPENTPKYAAPLWLGDLNSTIHVYWFSVNRTNAHCKIETSSLLNRMAIAE